MTTETTATPADNNAEIIANAYMRVENEVATVAMARLAVGILRAHSPFVCFQLAHRLMHATAASKGDQPLIVDVRGYAREIIAAVNMEPPMPDDETTKLRTIVESAAHPRWAHALVWNFAYEMFTLLSGEPTGDPAVDKRKTETPDDVRNAAKLFADACAAVITRVKSEIAAKAAT